MREATSLPSFNRVREDREMVLPPKPVEITFEELLQELPPEYYALAFEFRTFARSRAVRA
jgi:hypothetical protein